MGKKKKKIIPTNSTPISYTAFIGNTFQLICDPAISCKRLTLDKEKTDLLNTNIKFH